MTKIICVVLPLLAADHVAAQPEEESSEPLWEWNLAAFGRYGPSYPASEETQFDFLPLPFPVYRGKIWRFGEDTENPIRGRLFRRDYIKLDFAFDLNFPSDSDKIAARVGMPDLDFVVEVGPELELQFRREPLIGGAWFFTPQLKLAVSFDGIDPGYEGLVFSPELQYRKKYRNGQLRAKFKITPIFATERYMDYFYTVDPKFSTATRPAYDADGGYLGTELGLTLRQKLNDTLEVVVGLRVGIHNGATNDDSPLFTDDLTNSVFAAFLWKFWESERRAVD